MKRILPTIIVVLFASLLLPSCKKDHTCTCNIQFQGYTIIKDGVITSYIGSDSTVRYDLGKQSKNDAKNSCNSHQASLSNTYYNPPDSSATVNCGI